MVSTKQNTNALLVYWATETPPPTVTEQISAISSIGGVCFDYINLNMDNPGLSQPYKKLKAFFNRRNLSQYDVILFHNTASYSIKSLEKINFLFSDNLTSCRAKKILFKQDEMIAVNNTVRFIHNYKIDSLFTCLPEEEIHKVYPSQLKCIPILTGYLTPEMIYKKNKSLSERSIDISYRGMKPPPEWGALSYEKYSIANDFCRYAKRNHLKMTLDISGEVTDRVDAQDWIRLLENSKACLAVESGASIFDFDGSIKKKCDDYKKKYPQAPFSEYQNNILKPHEGNISYNQISPRHLEAAATETALIMFEGEYSGYFHPNQHYIPLKKNFSNFPEVIDRFNDTNLLKEITSNCKSLIETTKELHQAHFLDLVREELIT